MSHRVFVLAALFVSGLTGAHAQSAMTAPERPAYSGRPLGEWRQVLREPSRSARQHRRIDRAIIALMAERGQYVAEAGRFKADPAAVSAPARVEAIIAKVRTMARQNGLAEDVVEPRLSRDDRRVRGLRAGRMEAAQRGRRESAEMSEAWSVGVAGGDQTRRMERRPAARAVSAFPWRR